MHFEIQPKNEKKAVLQKLSSDHSLYELNDKIKHNSYCTEIEVESFSNDTYFRYIKFEINGTQSTILEILENLSNGNNKVIIVHEDKRSNASLHYYEKIDENLQFPNFSYFDPIHYKNTTTINLTYLTSYKLIFIVDEKEDTTWVI